MSARPRIVVLGAGPTGLGAASRLRELGYDDWLLLEAAEGPGGLASSVVDREGFTWDLGGHVVFSHYERFDRALDEALGDGWLEHDREAWAWLRDRFVPYPVQNNIWRLPTDDLLRCLLGFAETLRPRNGERIETFRDWILTQFGPGLAEVFLFPYNFKVWGYRPERLGAEWMGERVARIDLRRILRNLVLQRDDTGWGPNARFRFPLRGGTGAIWRAVAGELPADHVRFGREVVSIDPAARCITLSGGESERYDALVSSVPLDRLLRMLAGEPGLASQADRLVYSSAHIVGMGFAGQPSDALRTKCWMYFSEPQVPFYRATVFSNYSPNNVPRPGEQWSLMLEVCESPDKPVDQARLVDDVLEAARACRLVPAGTEVLSRWHRRLEHGYPTPFLGRDRVLAAVDERLRELGIFSRGRFGAWKYEVSNQDHSFMQGVEAVDRIVLGEEEVTVFHPDRVNGVKRCEPGRAGSPDRPEPETRRAGAGATAREGSGP